MQNSGVKVESMLERKKQPLRGKTLVFSGELEDFTRDQAREEAEALGARVTSSVSGETDYLVLGDSPGSKKDEAEKQGVRCIDEKAFKKMLGGS